MAQYHLYGLGAALVDTEIQVSDTDLTQLNIDKGVMTLVDEARQGEILKALDGHMVHAKMASGGSAANTVIAASYFGAKSFYSCKVADDKHGQFYLNDLNAAGVAHPQIDLEAGTTGKCLVLITPDAERTMNTYLGISETVSVKQLDLAALEASEYAYIEGYLVSSETGRAAAIELRQQAEKLGVKTALSLSDPAMVQFFKDGLKEMIGAGVDLLFCNEAEALTYTDTDSVEAACEALKAIAKTFAITLGAEGALVFDGENSHTINSNPVTAVDTNGAGDMFAGAFIYGISQGWDFAKAGELASLASAQVVSQYGPRLAAEQHAELLKAL